MLSNKIVLLENFDIRVYNNQWQIRGKGGEIRIIDRAIAGVSRPSHEAMAVIPTTVEFVHCELDAIYSEDLLQCHTGSPLDQFVSQSHRNRRSSSSRGSLLEPEKSREMRLIRRCFLLLDRSFLQSFGCFAVIAPIGLPVVSKRIRSSFELHEY